MRYQHRAVDPQPRLCYGQLLNIITVGLYWKAIVSVSNTQRSYLPGSERESSLVRNEVDMGLQ